MPSRLLTLLALIAVPATASANLVFDLRSPGLLFPVAVQPLLLTESGVDLLIEGYSHSGGASANSPFTTLTPRSLVSLPDGLGVASPGDAPFTLTSLQLEATGPNEMIRFTTSEPMQITSVVFGLASAGDEFDFSIDGVDFGVNSALGSDEIITAGAAETANDADLFFPSADFRVDFTGPGTVGTTFDFYTDDGNDDFSIIEINFAPALDPSSVPEAATMLAWGLGACLLATRTRREEAA